MRLYFLPPPAGQPNYWTKELIEYLPKVPGRQFTDVSLLDPQSGTWRVVYVVDSYTTAGGTTYNYNGDLGQPVARLRPGRGPAAAGQGSNDE